MYPLLILLFLQKSTPLWILNLWRGSLTSDKLFVQTVVFVDDDDEKRKARFYKLYDNLRSFAVPDDTI